MRPLLFASLLAVLSGCPGSVTTPDAPALDAPALDVPAPLDAPLSDTPDEPTCSTDCAPECDGPTVCVVTCGGTSIECGCCTCGVGSTNALTCP